MGDIVNWAAIIEKDLEEVVKGKIEAE